MCRTQKTYESDTNHYVMPLLMTKKKIGSVLISLYKTGFRKLLKAKGVKWCIAHVSTSFYVIIWVLIVKEEERKKNKVTIATVLLPLKMFPLQPGKRIKERIKDATVTKKPNSLSDVQDTR